MQLIRHRCDQIMEGKKFPSLMIFPAIDLSDSSMARVMSLFSPVIDSINFRYVTTTGEIAFLHLRAIRVTF